MSDKLTFLFRPALFVCLDDLKNLAILRHDRIILGEQRLPHCSRVRSNKTCGSGLLVARRSTLTISVQPQKSSLTPPRLPAGDYPLSGNIFPQKLEDLFKHGWIRPPPAQRLIERPLLDAQVAGEIALRKYPHVDHAAHDFALERRDLIPPAGNSRDYLCDWHGITYADENGLY